MLLEGRKDPRQPLPNDSEASKSTCGTVETMFAGSKAPTAEMMSLKNLNCRQIRSTRKSALPLRTELKQLPAEQWKPGRLSRKPRDCSRCLRWSKNPRDSEGHLLKADLPLSSSSLSHLSPCCCAPSFLMNCCRCERSKSRGRSAEGEEATIEPINQRNENGGSHPDALHVCLFLISRRRRGGSASREP